MVSKHLVPAALTLLTTAVAAVSIPLIRSCGYPTQWVYLCQWTMTSIFAISYSLLQSIELPQKTSLKDILPKGLVAAFVTTVCLSTIGCIMAALLFAHSLYRCSEIREVNYFVALGTSCVIFLVSCMLECYVGFNCCCKRYKRNRKIAAAEKVHRINRPKLLRLLNKPEGNVLFRQTYAGSSQLPNLVGLDPCTTLYFLKYRCFRLTERVLSHHHFFLWEDCSICEGSLEVGSIVSVDFDSASLCHWSCLRKSLQTRQLVGVNLASWMAQRWFEEGPLPPVVLASVLTLEHSVHQQLQY